MEGCGHHGGQLYSSLHTQVSTQEILSSFLHQATTIDMYGLCLCNVINSWFRIQRVRLQRAPG